MINLVSKASLQDLWQRHIVDSAQLVQFCPRSAQRWIDLGSGGGFPGVIVAILAREVLPELRITLVEADLRKATFLRQATQTLALDVAVLSERIESLQPGHADVLSARALAALPSLLEFAEQHLNENGTAIFPKGERFADEIVEAQKNWVFDVDIRPSISAPDAAILVIRNIHRAKHH